MPRGSPKPRKTLQFCTEASREAGRCIRTKLNRKFLNGRNLEESAGPELQRERGSGSADSCSREEVLLPELILLVTKRFEVALHKIQPVDTVFELFGKAAEQ